MCVTVDVTAQPALRLCCRRSELLSQTWPPVLSMKKRSGHILTSPRDFTKIWCRKSVWLATAYPVVLCRTRGWRFSLLWLPLICFCLHTSCCCPRPQRSSRSPVLLFPFVLGLICRQRHQGQGILPVCGPCIGIQGSISGASRH